MKEEKKLIKDRECIKCKKFFVCNGKERGKSCLYFEERKPNEQI